MTPEQQATLAAFGAAVLQTLERDADWGADTLDAIQCEAQSRDLATHNRGGYFGILPPWRQLTREALLMGWQPMPPA